MTLGKLYLIQLWTNDIPAVEHVYKTKNWGKPLVHSTDGTSTTLEGGLEQVATIAGLGIDIISVLPKN